MNCDEGSAYRWLGSFHALCLATIVCALPLVPAVADEPDDPFLLVVSQLFRYDDNLFRLADGASPADGGERDEGISVTRVGARYAQTHSLQRINASVGASFAAFQDRNRLDYSVKRAAAAWNWAVGRRWTGMLEFDYDEVPRDFADFAGANDEVSINDRSTIGVSASYWFHPDWAVSAGVEHYDSSFSDPGSRAAAYEEMIYDGGVTVRTGSGNQLSLTGRFTDGRYPNRVATATLDDGYRQTEIRLTGEWRLTGTSTASGFIGFTEREYDRLDVKDFSGPTGRLQYDWDIGGKTSLSTVARREIGAREDLDNNFIVVTALAITPTWKPTERIRVSGSWEIKDRDFGGDPGFLATTIDPDDVTRSWRASVAYEPFDNVNLALSHRYASRTAEVDSSEFRANVTELLMRVLF